MSQFFPSGSQRIGASVSTSVLLVIIQDWFPLGWPGWISLQSKGLSRVFSNTTVQKHPFLGPQLSLWSNSHMTSWAHHFKANRSQKSWNSDRLYFLGLQNHCRWWLQSWKLKTLAPWMKSYDKHRQYIKKQKHYFADQDPSGQSYGFPSSHVRMWELDYKESWALKNWCFWAMVLVKTLESPLDCKEIKPINPKGTQSWIFIGRTEAEAPVLWPPDAKSQLIRKDPDAGKDWRQEEKGSIEDEVVGWHHQLNGHDFE